MNYRQVCVITAGDHRIKPETIIGFFHAWGGLSERPFAIIEREDGQVIFCASDDSVRFLEPLLAVDR